MISSINNFPIIASLNTLSISNNNINNLSVFITTARTKFPSLTSLNTFRNPMNPGVGQASSYSQYKSYMRQLGKLTELDGMNINDNSFLNQQQQPKQDLFGTSTGAQPKRDLFGTTSNPTPIQTTNKVNFFDSAPSTNTNMNANMNTNQVFQSTNPTMNVNYQNQSKPKMGMFDNSSIPAKQNISQSTNMASMFATQNPNNVVKPVSSGNNASGLIFKRQFFVIDESAEIDGSEFVNSKKKKSLIMVNEKILKKSDNMTKFNRKNKCEGNKHILNSEL